MISSTQRLGSFPRPDSDELQRRLEPIRLALGAEHLAVARRLPGAPDGPPRLEVLAQLADTGPVEPPDHDLPITFVLELVRTARPLDVRADDPPDGPWSRVLAERGIAWMGGWPLPSDRLPSVFAVAWRRSVHEPGTVRRQVAAAGMEALARALAPPVWFPFTPSRPGPGPESGPAESEDDGSLSGALARVERDLIVRALHAAEGNKTRAARELQLSRQGLYRKLRRHGLVVSRPRTRQDPEP